MIANKLIRGIDYDLWQELKAQAKLECISITAWIEEALSAQLGSEQHRRKRLPNKAICYFCNQEIYKRPKEGQKKLIVHHDQPNNRNASVAMLVCPHCHRHRHHHLGWGISNDYFTCCICKKRYHKREIGFEHRKYKSYPLGDGHWKTNIRKFNICEGCWRKGVSFDSNNMPKPASLRRDN